VALPVASAAEPVPVQRTAGGDRIATAVAASRDHREQATDALLATANGYADALAATSLAATLDAPLLLTGREDLHPSVLAELQRLQVETVWVVGGEQVVSAAVDVGLRINGFTVRRLAGDDRYSTARDIAAESVPPPTGEVVLALGEHPEPGRAWPDALAADALAASPDRLPTALTQQDWMPPQTEEALDHLGARSVLVLGGTAAIRPVVEERLTALGYEVQRISGDSRYDTSVALATIALERFPAGKLPVVFASGQDYPDALSAGALASEVGGPLVLVPPDDLTTGVEEFLRAHADRWERGIVVGGAAAIGDFVVTQLEASLRGEPAPRPVAVQSEPAPPPPPPPAEERVTSVFHGEASWYGPGFAGRRTACGERFDPNKLTAAHRSLPCNTRVRVTNTANGAQVIVRINDRGPYAGGRVLDLSQHGADVLGYRGAGTAYVRAEVLAGTEPGRATHEPTGPPLSGSAREEGKGS